MKDLLFSAALHVVIVAATFLSAPFEFQQKREYGEIIRVNAVSMSEITPAEPELIPPPAVPEALEAEPPEIPIDDMTTKPLAKIDEPAKEPKPEPLRQIKADQGEGSDRAQAGTEDGRTEIDAPAGSLISGVAIDNASFNYPYWFTMTWGKINQNFRIPIAIDGKAYCDIYFQVIKSGRVIELKVAGPSGIPAFDIACLAAVERSAPFPPLPREFLDEIIGITITFTN